MNHARWLFLLAMSRCLLAASPASASLAATTPFTVRWTAPGDDGVTGRATAYDLRYSVLPLTGANFALATKITGLPLPAVAGTLQSFVVSGLHDTASYYLAIKTVDEAGNWSGLSNVVLRPTSTTGVGLPVLAFSFSSPYPNPARQSVRWSYSLPQAARVEVHVFDVLGRRVHTVESGDRPAGSGEFAWDMRGDDGRVVDVGIYFVRARLGSNDWTKRLVVVR